MRGIQNQTKIVQFEDNYLQAYFADGTSMSWLNDSMTYYSLKGNRIKISVDTLKFSEDVSQKITKIVQCQNRFNDDYVELPKNLRGDVKVVMKKYKIKEFTWNNPVVRITQKGYELASDDNNARFWLSHDLFRVYVQYLQLTSFKEVSKEAEYLHGQKNQRRLLLQKYSFKYHQFPTSGCVDEILNEYHLITKQFTIFNLPPRWCPPIKLIWSYILANELVPHPFCYIDFSEPQNKILDKIQVSKMPVNKPLEDYKKYEEKQVMAQVITFPLYGKPNHNNKFRWMHVSNQQTDIIGYACQTNNILCQKEGFWFIEGSKAIYNTNNKDKHEYQVILSAFPITIRFENQNPRQIKPHILAFNAYLQHRDMLIYKQKNKVVKKVIQSDDDIVLEEFIDNVGVFKAFKNRMVKGNFDDRVILTIRGAQIKVIDPFGKSWIVGSDPVLNNKFGWHIGQLSNFYQKVFEPEAYHARMELNQILEQRKQLSNVFMQVTKHVKSNDY